MRKFDRVYLNELTKWNHRMQRPANSAKESGDTIARINEINVYFFIFHLNRGSAPRTILLKDSAWQVPLMVGKAPPAKHNSWQQETNIISWLAFQQLAIVVVQIIFTIESYSKTWKFILE